MTPLSGLVLAGGHSSRMQEDKAALVFGRQPQLAEAYALLAPRTSRAFVSVRADQQEEPLRARFPQVVDGAAGQGPIAGILAAQALDPGAAWLVVACDLPLLDGATLDELIAGRDPARVATAFRSSHDGLPEPLCAIWEPTSAAWLSRWVASGQSCPRRFLMRHDARLLDAARPRALDNANTPQDAASVRAALAAGGRA
ncbi:MAG TPA: NTP transferase domain-containing protein [Steroidobacteraceae bacterium]|nr:NTP transferase domain-containing protein [Steroidobacteraceae bacterium]